MQNTLLVTIDSLRADHVSHLGYKRDTTPNIDNLAEDGATFTNAFAHSCSTRPSFPSILTSAYSTMYGGYERVSEDQTIISEFFDDEGYQTAGFHSNLYLSGDFNYDRGFDTFYDSKTDPSPTARLRQAVKDRLDSDGVVYQTLARIFDVTERQVGANIGSAYVTADEITDLAVDWIGKTEEASPKFLWVHYMDVHHPYVPPTEYQSEFREEPISERHSIQLRRKMIEEPDAVSEEERSKIIDLYDAEIRFCDDEIGRLISRARDAWDGVNVMVTSDHGEAFGEHGKFSHHATFHDEVIHVPLVFHDGRHSGTYDEFVGLLDVSPSLVDAVGLPLPENFHGYSFQELFSDDWERDYIIGDWINTNTDERRLAYRDDRWKYIQFENKKELFDLDDDPGETTNVVGQHTDVVRRCRDAIDQHIQRVAQTDTDLGDVEMEEQVKERLRKLGYKE